MSKAMTSPAITVCTPVYNLERYVGETLGSIAAQTFSDFEVIIIDDGSTDNSAKVIEPFLSDPRFRYIRQDNKGVGAARNKAIELARGEWFAMLDSDDLYLPHALELLSGLARSDSKANFVYANMEMFREDGFRQVAFRDHCFLNGDIAAWLCEGYGFSTQHVMMKIEDLRAIGGFREHFPALEDYDLYLRFAHHGVWAKSHNEVIARYRVHSESKTANLLRNAQLSIDIVQEAIARETRPDLIKALRRVSSEHHGRLHLYAAWNAEMNGRNDTVEHLWKYLRYKPRHKKILLAAVLRTLSRITHLDLGRHYVRAVLNNVCTTPWGAYGQSGATSGDAAPSERSQ